MSRAFPGWTARALHCSLYLCLLQSNVCHGAIKLDALGGYLTAHGYGGAQLVDSGNFYHLPILSNGKAGNLVIDTGAPTTLIFRSSVKRLALSETQTDMYVSGAFGPGRDRYGVAVISSLAAGNFTVTNVPVAIAPDVGRISTYGRPDGLLGLRELMKFGAILDLAHRILYLRPSRPPHETAAAVKSMLEASGWKAVRLSLARNHLRVPGEVNDLPCHFIVDTGAYLTALDRNFAAQAKLSTRPTRATAHGVGGSGGSVALATFSSLWIGDYQIKRASASVIDMDPKMLGRGTNSEVAGLLGVEYLALNSAIFDFVSGTLYLRPRLQRPADLRRGRSINPSARLKR